jgi:putative transposase
MTIVHLVIHNNMATPRRRFTDEEKIEILHQANLSGITNVLRKNNLSYSVYVKWKEKFRQNIDKESEQMTKAEMMLVLEENKRLKKIVADQALSIEQKMEELKKIKDQPNWK